MSTCIFDPKKSVCFIPVGVFSDRRVFRILFYWDPRLFRKVFRKGLGGHLEPIFGIDRNVIRNYKAFRILLLVFLLFFLKPRIVSDGIP